MKLRRREIVTIALGVAAVAAMIAWRATGSGAADAPLAAANTIPGALARIDEHDRLQRSVAALGDELGIEIPRVSTGDQETSIRKDLNAKAQANGMQITSMRRLEGTSRRATRTAEPIEFRLELTGQFASVLGFIYSLENATLPYVVRDAHISASKGGGSRGQASPSAGRANPTAGRAGPSAARAGAPASARRTPASARSGAARPSSSSSRGGRSSNSAGMVRVTMRVQSYLFPEVALAEATQAERETESNEDETAASSEPQSEDEAMEADDYTEPSENEPERTEEPTPKATATPTPMTLESDVNLRYETFSLDSSEHSPRNVRIMTVPGGGGQMFIIRSQSEDQ